MNDYSVNLDTQEVIVKGSIPYEDVLARIKKTGKEVCCPLSGKLDVLERHCDRSALERLWLSLSLRTWQILNYDEFTGVLLLLSVRAYINRPWNNVYMMSEITGSSFHKLLRGSLGAAGVQ